MYYSHFGLSQAPFKITPNIEFFFGGGNRGPILEALIYAVTHGEGIIKVTGEVGSGKTVLCNMLQTRLPQHIETVYLVHPSVSPAEILHAIAFELQLGIDRSAPRLEVMHILHDYLLKRHAEGKCVVVFVEESQGMPLATLEEIRLLSNLETHYDKLLQIVLFGQPELDDKLRQTNIRQLRERITHSFRLEPLTAGEIHEYVMFRMRVAGYHGPDLFSAEVVRYMARASGGLTRRVNLIADKALLAAFSQNTHTIKLSHVEAAVRDSEFSQHQPHRVNPSYVWGTALVLAGAAIGVVVYSLILYGNESASRAETGGTMAPIAADRLATPTTTSHPAAAPAAAKASVPAASNAQDDARTNIKQLVKTIPSKGSANAIAMPSGGAKASLPAGAPATIAAAQPALAAAPSAGPPLQQPGAEPDLVAQRLASTQEWLANAVHTTYSIQLMGIDDELQLKQHLNDIAKFVEMNKVYLYRTIAKRKPSLTVLYGSYSNRRVAEDALGKLPPSLKAYRPILRTVGGIRMEIMQYQRS